LHFNSALVDAAKAIEEQLANGNDGNSVGAMSTAEIGKIFAEMIRQDKVQIISCTGKFRRDIMNLVAHSHYEYQTTI
jgi:deoxyhypusine synthase